MSEESKSRICRACGKDCTGQPRIKDKKGRYLHKACYEKARAKAEAKKAAEAAAVAQDDGMFDLNPDGDAGMFDDIQIPDSNLEPSSDEGLNFAAQPSVGKTKAPKVKSEGSGAAVKSAAWVLALVGAAVGGGLAVTAWIFAVSVTQKEYFVAALLLGFLPGFGAALLAGKHKGAVTGLIAAAVTLVALPVAKFGAVGFINQTAIDEFTEDFTSSFDETWLTENDAKEILAYRASIRAERRGEQLDWPAGMDVDTAIGFLEFPPSITGPIRDDWDARDEASKEALKDEIMAESQMGLLVENWAAERVADGTPLAWPEGMSFADAMLIEDYPADLVASARQYWDGMSRQEQIAHVTQELNRFTHQFTTADGTIDAYFEEYDAMDFGWDALITFGAMVLAFGTGAGMTGDEDEA